MSYGSSKSSGSISNGSGSGGSLPSGGWPSGSWGGSSSSSSSSVGPGSIGDLLPYSNLIWTDTDGMGSSAVVELDLTNLYPTPVNIFDITCPAATIYTDLPAMYSMSPSAFVHIIITADPNVYLAGSTIDFNTDQGGFSIPLP